MMRKIFTLIFVLVLGISLAFGQLPGTQTYDFRDGTIIANGGSTDGALKLSGLYSLHGGTYGMNMKVDGLIKIAVNGSRTLKFLGSAYSGLKMEGRTSSGADLGSQVTKVTTDLTDTYDFVYTGAADTLTFTTVAGTGNDLYLPKIDVIPAQAGGDASLMSAVRNIIYYFDLRDGSIIPNQTSLNGNYTINQGLFKIECGPSNAYGYNGSQHGSILKTGNKITLQVAGNSYIRVGGCQYSNGTISVSSATGSFDITSQQAKTTNCFDQDGSTVNFLYVGSTGTVVLDFTGTNYVPYIEIDPVPFAVSLNPYVQKSGTITINGVTINLASGATAADAATVTLSEGIVFSSTMDEASVAFNLGGSDLSALTPTFTGDISAATITNDVLAVTYANQSTTPKSYNIKLYDNSYLHGQSTYDFRDGAIITAGKSTDGSLTLNGGSYSLHGGTYGMNMKLGGNINISVAGSRTFKFLGSAYSGLKMEGTAAIAGDMGTQDTKVATDLTDTYDFTYSGGTDTLNFKTIAGSGNDLYLPKIDLYPAQLGEAYTSYGKRYYLLL